jgi:pimeloyl-ACP methyl ester carboxylesterase
VEVLARRLPSAGLQPIDGAGHVPHLTHPYQLAELIEDFWASVGDKVGRPA